MFLDLGWISFSKFPLGELVSKIGHTCDPFSLYSLSINNFYMLIKMLRQVYNTGKVLRDICGVCMN